MNANPTRLAEILLELVQIPQHLKPYEREAIVSGIALRLHELLKAEYSNVNTPNEATISGRD